MRFIFHIMCLATFLFWECYCRCGISYFSLLTWVVAFPVSRIKLFTIGVVLVPYPRKQMTNVLDVRCFGGNCGDRLHYDYATQLTVKRDWEDLKIAA
ncbi:hypothetical protein DM02DRAFT_133005 [Periconia macrospinosa]|uniref:Secreted protein n=1 Tax=Periconia macrospinosa TaxID=97972 RepID=A0A2V1DFL2_9PLEO|nr:hypothetical protein DM02DRAFT_133005 [Periconia macrospinosa]